MTGGSLSGAGVVMSVAPDGAGCWISFKVIETSG